MICVFFPSKVNKLICSIKSMLVQTFTKHLLVLKDSPHHTMYHIIRILKIIIIFLIPTTYEFYI